MNGTIISGPRYYPPQAFDVEQDGEIAGWVGYVRVETDPFGRTREIEEMYPMSVGAFCYWTPDLAAQYRTR